MRRLLVLPLVLAGCALFAPTPDTPQGRCEAQAYDDPVVRQLNTIIAGSSPEAAQDAIQRLPEAKRLATIRCLRGVGLAPLGGVEGQKRN